MFFFVESIRFTYKLYYNIVKVVFPKNKLIQELM